MCWLCLAQSPDDALAPSTRFSADAPQPTAPRLFLTATGNPGVDGLLSGYAWTMGDPVSFAFPDSATDYESFYGSAEPSRGFVQIGAAMRDAVRKILLGEAAGVTTGPGSPGPSVIGITNLQVVQAAQDNLADIRIARSSAPSTAWAYYPNAREGGDVWFGSRHAFDTPRLGSYQFATAVHELGHALGLKHPHDAGNGFAAMPIEWDTMEFTVMSYRSKPGASVTQGYTNGTFDYAQGLMMLDIAALQVMYGADYGFRSGDTRYSWNPATGETVVDGVGQGAPGDGSAAGNRVFLTIWDGGGVDTYDLSNYANGVAVDLAPGGWSLLSAAQLATLDVRDGTKARGNVFNALMQDGNAASLIENATGGAGADTLAGNQAANWLRGGAGNDLLDGRNGADLLDGGAGTDTMIGGAGSDLFVVDEVGDVVIEAVGGGVDAITAATAGAVMLQAGVEILRLGTLGRHGIGGGGNDFLLGSAFADRIEGRGGNDVIEGGRGNDTLLGGQGADRFIFRRGDGVDRIEDFSAGTDQLVLAGFGLTAAQAMARATETAAGLAVDLGGGDGVLLAGLTAAQFGASDLVL